MAILGIDVSHYQGTIDWSKVAASKKFAILKCSQGSTYKDSKFEEYYTGANGKINLGCYIYNKVKTVAEAQAEATFAVKCLNGKSMPCGVWLDLEDSTMKGLGKTLLSQIIEAEASILKKAGYNVGIYCNKYWYDSVLDSANLKATYPFWIARYPSSDEGKYNDSSNLSPKAFSVCWQYSSKGSVDGISGNVDLDAAFKDLTTIWSSTTSSTATTVKSLNLTTTEKKNLQQILNTLGFKDADGNALAVDGKLGTKSYYAFNAMCEWWLN